MYKSLYVAMFFLIITPAGADQLNQMEAESIDLGGFHGVVYYIDEHDGYRVVATIAEGEGGLPVRFEATLTETQKLSISVPGKLNEQSQVLEISRAAGKLVIAAPQPTANEVVVSGRIGLVRASVPSP
jgi:hypothetical protein